MKYDWAIKSSLCLATILLMSCGGGSSKPATASNSSAKSLASSAASNVSVSSFSSGPAEISSSSLSVTSAATSSSSGGLSMVTLASGVQEFSLTAKNTTLKLYALKDNLIYIRYLAQNAPSASAIVFSEMIAPQDFHGAGSLAQQLNTFSTAALKVSVDKDLCVSLEDIAQQSLNKTCPTLIADNQFTLSIAAPDTSQAYGLGEQFFDPVADGNWLGRTRTPGTGTGNRMVSYAGGQVGNLQIPVLLTFQKNKAVGYFVDSPHAQTWNLSNSASWSVNAYSNRFGLFIFTEDNFNSLRQDYMQLTGTPPVPPKSAFGLWVSEYGFDNWAEAEAKIAAQHSANMPIDGVVLDLQWFGGIAQHRMGSLTWDTKTFPDAAARLASWKTTWGVNAVTIEEPYIDSQVEDFASLGTAGYLVRKCEGCSSTLFNQWWGAGGMMDWSHKEGAAHWHTAKRTPLIAAGVAGHWTDLGEPENFDPKAWYADTYTGLRHDHASIHNLYNFYWSKSIFDGYSREQPNQRPWILSRSGTAGSQRFGATFWSGDIGSDSKSLAAHQQVQMHMSMSGYDYFGSDVGGFQRGNISAANFKKLYTLWFASSALFDIPLRPHTENLCNCKETAPALAGDTASNRFNLQLRYQLVPYYYSLAHQAYRNGTAIFPPLAYYHPQDANAIGLSNVKYIGSSLLARNFANPADAAQLSTYIPAGNWLDWHNQTWIKSSGQSFVLNGLYNGVTTLPLLAKEGAIIPMMYVDDKTINLKGQRSDKSTRNELLVRVVAGTGSSEFSLYEDDGSSMAYQTGSVATTLIRQQVSAGEYQVSIAPSSGSYSGMPDSRSNQIELFALDAAIKSVSLNNQPLALAASLSEYNALSQGAYKMAGGHWLAKSPAMALTEEKLFRFSE